MGYETYHKLKIVEGDDYITEYEKEISESTGYNNCFSDSIKWYEHERDMRKYSKEHPKTLFKLSGEGEDSGDLWEEYYLDGKMQRCNAKIIYEKFDSSKLD